jgi:hypothetical protein
MATLIGNDDEVSPGMSVVPVAIKEDIRHIVSLWTGGRERRRDRTGQLLINLVVTNLHRFYISKLCGVFMFEENFMFLQHMYQRAAPLFLEMEHKVHHKIRRDQSLQLHSEGVERVELLDMNPAALAGRVLVVQHEHMHLLLALAAPAVHQQRAAVAGGIEAGGKIVKSGPGLVPSKFQIFTLSIESIF